MRQFIDKTDRVRKQNLLSIFQFITSRRRIQRRKKHVQLLSAKKKQGFDELLEKIEKILNEDFVRIEKTFSYQEAGKIQIIREYGRLDTEEYRDDGIYVEAAVPAAYVGKVMG